MLLLFYFVLAPQGTCVLHCAQQELCRDKHRGPCGRAERKRTYEQF